MRPLSSCVRLIGAVPAWLLLSLTVARAAEPIVRIGDWRLTVITPNLIRIEQSNRARFVDDRSMFAVNREARFTEFQLLRDTDHVIVDTGAIRVRCGTPGISAAIRHGDRWVNWQPGLQNACNLGGTIRTLDGVSGSVDLGDGVLSRDGWYLLDDSRTPLLTDGWVRSRAKDAGTDWYLFGYGKDYKAALRSLTAIGGAIPMPRRYMLGAWYSRYWNYSADDYRQIVNEYRQHDFPLDVMVMDMDWHITALDEPSTRQSRGGQIWTGYTWDRKLIPDPQGLLGWFHEQNLAVTLNDHPADGVQPHESMYEPFMRELGMDSTTLQTIPFDAGDKRYLDTFWKHTHAPHLSAGVDFWWLDWQQFQHTRSIPDLSNLAWLNHYYFQHTGTDGRRGASFSRWAGWGDHRHPIHFSGDAHTGWPMLAFEVPFTSTAGNVGCFFWSHDIGGHQGGRNEESYARWCQFGATTAALRSHSTKDPTMDRRPWTYPKWAEESMRASFHLRSKLFPYIYSSAWQSTRDSVPLNRPMYLDHAEDQRAYWSHQQYMFGDALLVAHVVSPGAGPNRLSRQVVWFPKGSWYNYFTCERYVGDCEALVAADINEFPLYFRGGVPVPMQPYTQRMASTPINTLVVRCYPGDDGETGRFTLYEDDGVTTAYRQDECMTTDLTYVRRGAESTITISAGLGRYKSQPTERAYVVELPCLRQPASARIDGEPIVAEYDEPTRTARIAVPKRPIERPVTVVVDAAPADSESIAREAQVRRARSSDSAEASLWTRGIGIMRANDGPYGHGGSEIIRFYAMPGTIDANRVTWSASGRRQEVAISGQPFVVPQQWDEGQVVTLRRTGTISFTIDDKPAQLDVPLPIEPVLQSERNVARHAKAVASSTENGYRPEGAIDGKVGGYPASKSVEWASNGEKANASIRLEWPSPQKIDTVALFDRPNMTDQVTSAEMLFSDGSKLAVSQLDDGGSEPLELHFPAKNVTWLQIRVTGVKPGTMNAGFSEIAAFGKATN